MARRQVDESTETDLERWAVALKAGEIRLWELPPSVSQFFEIGWAEGSESRQLEIDRLIRVCEYRLDTAYMLAYTPKERHEEYQRRLDKYFHDRDAAFFTEPGQLPLHSLRGGQEPPEQGVQHASSSSVERSDRAA